MVFEIIAIVVLAILLLYLLAIMPKLKRNPYSKNLDGWLYAHRGLHNNKSEAPENSLPAFKLAVKQGYGIELDVQLTKDNVPVILHDYHLRRACKEDVIVADLTFQELQKYHLFRSKERIPTFEEALAVIDGKVPLIIELKIPGNPNRLCKIVSEILKNYNGIYCIESFNPFGLRWYRLHYPNVVRGQLASDFIKEKKEGSKFQYFVLKNMLLNFYTKPDFIAYHHIYKKSLSYTICRKLYHAKTAAWTIKSQQDYDDNQNCFDLFIFDSFIPEDKKEGGESLKKIKE